MPEAAEAETDGSTGRQDPHHFQEQIAQFFGTERT